MLWDQDAQLLEVCPPTLKSVKHLMGYDYHCVHDESSKDAGCIFRTLCMKDKMKNRLRGHKTFIMFYLSF